MTDSSSDLTRLLETLSEEIIAVTDEEVQQIYGRAIAGTAREVRQLINAARADGDDVLRADPGNGLYESGTVSRLTRMFRRPSHQRH